MIRPSTFSIAAFDSDQEAWGIAVASKFPASGAVVPWARAGAGAIATQSYANTSYGPSGLDLMEEGMGAQPTLERLLAQDEGRSRRQVGMVDADGGAATFTGEDCFEWAGGLTSEGYAIQGNILVGPQVVEAMAEAFAGSNAGFPRRLLSALEAGDDAGGDRRGRQSAAILVVKDGAGYGGFNDRWLDYRVDDHPDPVARLLELLDLHELYFGQSPPQDRVELRGEVLAALWHIMVEQGYLSDPEPGTLEAAASGLRAFVGNENFEERCDVEAGWIDRPVFEFLLRRFSG